MTDPRSSKTTAEFTQLFKCQILTEHGHRRTEKLGSWRAAGKINGSIVDKSRKQVRTEANKKQRRRKEATNGKGKEIKTEKERKKAAVRDGRKEGRKDGI